MLSQLELNCFYCLDWCEKVIDIREQYPLYLMETLAIAKELGVKHPRIISTGENVVMTTDFLVSIADLSGTREIAINVKYSKDLNNSRTIEKLEIERQYWQRRGIEWRIVTEHQIERNLVSNVKWLHSFALDIQILPNIHSLVVRKAVVFMHEIICTKSIPLRDITNLCDTTFSFQMGTSLFIVRWLLASRVWRVDMNNLIQPEKPLSLIHKRLEGGI